MRISTIKSSPDPAPPTSSHNKWGRLLQLLSSPISSAIKHLKSLIMMALSKVISFHPTPLITKTPTSLLDNYSFVLSQSIEQQLPGIPGQACSSLNHNIFELLTFIMATNKIAQETPQNLQKPNEDDLQNEGKLAMLPLDSFVDHVFRHSFRNSEDIHFNPKYMDEKDKRAVMLFTNTVLHNKGIKLSETGEINLKNILYATYVFLSCFKSKDTIKNVAITISAPKTLCKAHPKSTVVHGFLNNTPTTISWAWKAGHSYTKSQEFITPEAKSKIETISSRFRIEQVTFNNKQIQIDFQFGDIYRNVEA